MIVSRKKRGNYKRRMRRELDKLQNQLGLRNRGYWMSKKLWKMPN
jgi:hypothetical protein